MAAAAFQSLDDLVGAPGACSQSRSQVLDRLMMQGIDLNPVTQAGMKKGACLKGDLMRDLLAVTLLLVADEKVWLSFKFLVERASQGHIDQLHAPADAKKGQAGPDRQIKEKKLAGITLSRDRAGSRFFFLSVEGRIQIAPAGQEQAVTKVKNSGQRLLIPYDRDQDGRGSSP